MTWFLRWFDDNTLLFHLIAVSALFNFLLLALLPSGGGGRASRYEWAFLLSTAFVVFAWRWPAFFYPRHLQPDEGLWVAGALKATVDPTPWKGVDSTTSGPLSNYLLALPALFGARIDFVSTRVIGASLIALTMFALYYTVKWTYTERIARLGIILPVVMLSLSGDPDFVAFTSEYLPVFMITTALAATVYLANGKGSSSRRIIAAGVAGLFIGSAGFSKLQAAPIIATVFAFGAGTILLEAISKTKWAARHLLAEPSAPLPARERSDVPFGRRVVLRLGEIFKPLLVTRRNFKSTTPVIITALLGLCLMPAILLICLWLTGALNDAVTSYIKMPLAYVSEGGLVHLAYFFGFASYAVKSFTAFVVSAIVASVIGLAALAYRKGLKLDRPFAALCPVLLLVSAYFAIYKAHREFPHYLWFAIVPVSWFLAAVLGLSHEGNLWQKREGLIAILFAAVCVLPQLSIAMTDGNPFAGNVVLNCNAPPSKVAKAISRYAKPGTRLAIWGWMPEYYIETGTIMATRDAETAFQIYPNKYREYYRERYIRDLEAHLPGVFVDAVAPGAPRHVNRATEGYQTFPALARLIHDHYDFKKEISGVRIFTLRASASSSLSSRRTSAESGPEVKPTLPPLRPEDAPFPSTHSISLEEIKTLNQAVLDSDDDQLLIRATGTDPQLLLPTMKVGAESASALGIEIEAPADTEVQVYYQTLDMAQFTSEHAVSAPLKKGPNKVWLKINEVGINGRIRLDPGTVPGEYILRTVIFSSSDRSAAAK